PDVKLLWPITTSALAWLTIWLKRSTRLLLLSATHSAPFESNAMPPGSHRLWAVGALQFCETKSGCPITSAAAAPWDGLGEYIRMRLLAESDTNTSPKASSATLTGSHSERGPAGLQALTKRLVCPRTTVAFSAVVIGAGKSTTRLLFESVTQASPPASTATPWGDHKVLGPGSRLGSLKAALRLEKNPIGTLPPTG